MQAEFKHKWTTPLYKIKDDAIPTIFSHKEKPRSRLSSENRSKKRAKRELLSDACNVSSSSLISDISAGHSDSASISYIEPNIDEVYQNCDESRVDAAIMVDVSINTDLSFKPNSEIFFNLKYNTAIPSQNREEDVGFDYDSVSSASGTESQYELSGESESDMSDIERENKFFQ